MLRESAPCFAQHAHTQPARERGGAGVSSPIWPDRGCARAAHLAAIACIIRGERATPCLRSLDGTDAARLRCRCARRRCAFGLAAGHDGKHCH